MTRNSKCNHVTSFEYITLKEFKALHQDIDIPKEEIYGGKVKVIKCIKCGYFERKGPKLKKRLLIDPYRKQRIRKDFQKSTPKSADHIRNYKKWKKTWKK
ncbi:unnamed protein product [marine sediment metagenome]|uniref:Uncharacterized protein n=1 Tax=marine sediment metagenome TaxID=412755 RepID=X1QN83_9ZZZZ